MTSANEYLASFMVTEQDHVKVAVKYQIKQSEAQLAHYIDIEFGKKLKTNYVAYHCQQLIKSYQYLQQLVDKDVTDFSYQPDSEVTLQQCLIKIKNLQNNLFISRTVEGEKRYVASLLFYYQNLLSLVYEEEALSSASPDLASPLFKALVSAKSTEEWWGTLIRLGQVFVISPNLVKEKIFCLDAQQGIDLFYQFIQLDNINLINSLFYFKLNPDLLQNEIIQPEMLIKIKKRLERIYYFIENFHENLIHYIHQYTTSTLKDYLFHGDDLPAGLCMKVNDNYKKIILDTVKNASSFDVMDEEMMIHSAVDSIFHAYKHWFNPNRLIDAAMVLYRPFNSSNIRDAQENFTHYLSSVYQRLTTQQCIDLYGYFSNNDSRYLIRTLQAASEGKIIKNFPELDKSDRETVHIIYLVLISLMNTLISELKNRYLLVESFQPYDLDEVVKPGRRILQALKRIVYLYKETGCSSRNKLDNLFKRIEDIQETKRSNPEMI